MHSKATRKITSSIFKITVTASNPLEEQQNASDIDRISFTPFAVS